MNCKEPKYLVGAPQQQINMSNKKCFLKHPTMMDNTPIFICHDCALKYAAFFGLMEKWKILPLFVEPKLQTKKIWLMNENGCNTFSQFFNQIGD